MPKEHEAEWGQTEAVAGIHAGRLADVRAIRSAIAQAEQWYRDLQRRADDLPTVHGPHPDPGQRPRVLG